MTTGHTTVFALGKTQQKKQHIISAWHTPAPTRCSRIYTHTHTHTHTPHTSAAHRRMTQTGNQVWDHTLRQLVSRSRFHVLCMTSINQRGVTIINRHLSAWCTNCIVGRSVGREHSSATSAGWLQQCIQFITTKSQRLSIQTVRKHVGRRGAKKREDRRGAKREVELGEWGENLHSAPTSPIQIDYAMKNTI